MAHEHRIERLTNRLSQEMQKRIDSLAVGYRGGASQPPFSQRLTDEEQVQQYFAMTPERWQQMTTKYGIAAAREYSAAMGKLLQKLYGWQPQLGVYPAGAMDGYTAGYIGQHGVAPPIDANRVSQKAQQIVQSVMAAVQRNA